MERKELEVHRLHRPTTPFQHLHPYFKAFADYSGLFPSRPFLKMVKIQNGKQLSHMGND